MESANWERNGANLINSTHRTSTLLRAVRVACCDFLISSETAKLRISIIWGKPDTHSHTHARARAFNISRLDLFRSENLHLLSSSSPDAKPRPKQWELLIRFCCRNLFTQSSSVSLAANELKTFAILVSFEIYQAKHQSQRRSKTSRGERAPCWMEESFTLFTLNTDPSHWKLFFWMKFFFLQWPSNNWWCCCWFCNSTNSCFKCFQANLFDAHFT